MGVTIPRPNSLLCGQSPLRKSPKPPSPNASRSEDSMSLTDVPLDIRDARSNRSALDRTDGETLQEQSVGSRRFLRDGKSGDSRGDGLSGRAGAQCAARSGAGLRLCRRTLEPAVGRALRRGCRRGYRRVVLGVGSKVQSPRPAMPVCPQCSRRSDGAGKRLVRFHLQQHYASAHSAGARQTIRCRVLSDCFGRAAWPCFRFLPACRNSTEPCRGACVGFAGRRPRRRADGGDGSTGGR